MIVVGAAVIAFELVRRTGNLLGDSTERPAEAVLPIPAGTRALGVTGDGDAVSLLVEDADGRQQLITIDRHSGAVLGVLVLQPEP